jgi:hypothetical protein
LYIHIYHDVMIMMAFVIYLSPQNALSVYVFNLRFILWSGNIAYFQILCIGYVWIRVFRNSSIDHCIASDWFNIGMHL